MGVDCVEMCEIWPILRFLLETVLQLNDRLSLSSCMCESSDYRGRVCVCVCVWSLCVFACLLAVVMADTLLRMGLSFR